jgi:hypothetical protein
MACAFARLGEPRLPSATGYGVRGEAGRRVLLFVLPITVSLSLSLIADIDSPRGGLIHVAPLNLISLQQSLSSSSVGIRYGLAVSYISTFLQ